MLFRKCHLLDLNSLLYKSNISFKVAVSYWISTRPWLSLWSRLNIDLPTRLILHTVRIHYRLHDGQYTDIPLCNASQKGVIAQTISDYRSGYCYCGLCWQCRSSMHVMSGTCIKKSPPWVVYASSRVSMGELVTCVNQTRREAIVKMTCLSHHLRPDRFWC